MFRMPIAVKISGRSSTITNSFVNAIIPVFTPTDEEVREGLEVLGMSLGDVRIVAILPQSGIISAH